MVTQALLKELFIYDYITGHFIRIKKVNNNTVVGSVAGSINKENGYVYIHVDGSTYLAHRLAWIFVNGSIPDIDIDHINHNRADNGIRNLRLATRRQNMRNMKKTKVNTSGVTGVGWSKRDRRWRARIHINDSDMHLGNFEKFSDAVDARKNAEVFYGYHENHGKE